MMPPTKTEVESFVRTMLGSNPDWARKGLLAIYDRQTKTEQVTKETIDRNGKGFNGRDAKFLSSLAEQLRAKGFLSGDGANGQMKWVFRYMPKYAKQVVACSDEMKLMAAFQKYIDRLSIPISDPAPATAPTVAEGSIK